MEQLLRVYYGLNFITNKLDKQTSSLLKKRHILYALNNEQQNYLDVKVKDNKYYILDKEYFNIEEIIKTYNVFQKLYIDNINLDIYKQKLIELETKKNYDKHKEFNKYHKIFNKNFSVYDGINSIYEWYTGAVCFKDYEWEDIKNNPIKDVFETNLNNIYSYILPIDNGVLLRGADIYYYFSTDISRFEKPNHKQIDKWFSNCQIFIDKILKALSEYKINNNYDIRLLLGVVDNLRNMILLLLNTELLSLNKEKDFIYNINYNHTEVNDYIELINMYQEVILDMCLIRPLTKDYFSIVISILKKTKKYMKKTKQKVFGIDNEYILSKCFNPLREIDNYFENYITCKYALKEIKKTYSEISEINLISVLYGGLELPLIVNKLNLIKVNVGFVFQNHGMYLERQKKEKNITDKSLVEIGTFDKNKQTFIIDDNMMSGITIQFIYNKLMVNDYNITGEIVLRHPNINRLPQLIYFDTAVNLDMVDKTIFGFLTDTPYSKIKYNSNHNNMFVNELNIFSVMTEVFLKALYCNNSFIKDSQVDIFLGYSEGKDEI